MSALIRIRPGLVSLGQVAGVEDVGSAFRDRLYVAVSVGGDEHGGLVLELHTLLNPALTDARNNDRQGAFLQIVRGGDPLDLESSELHNRADRLLDLVVSIHLPSPPLLLWLGRSEPERASGSCIRVT